jgi:hypothetical protein
MSEENIRPSDWRGDIVGHRACLVAWGEKEKRLGCAQNWTMFPGSLASRSVSVTTRLSRLFYRNNETQIYFRDSYWS